MRNRRRKQTKLMIIIILLFITIGYSLLSKNINIVGNANLDITYYKKNVEYTCTQQKWGSNPYDYQFECTVTNITNETLSNWTIHIEVPNQTTLTNSWGAARTSLNNNVITVKNNTWEPLAPSAQIVFNFQISSPLDSIIINHGYGTKQEEEPDITHESETTEGMSAQITQISSWDNTYQYRVEIKNETGYQIVSWELKLTVTENTLGKNFWSTNYVLTNNVLTQTPIYNNIISNNGTITFEFMLENSTNSPSPTLLSIRGSKT